MWRGFDGEVKPACYQHQCVPLNDNPKLWQLNATGSSYAFTGDFVWTKREFSRRRLTGREGRHTNGERLQDNSRQTETNLAG